MSKEDLRDEVREATKTNQGIQQREKASFQTTIPEDFKNYRDIKRGRKSSVIMGGSNNGIDSGRDS